MQTLLPAPIQDQLTSVRRKLRAVLFALGLARAVLFAASAVVLLFILDTSLQPPVPVLRSFALFVVMVAGAGATIVLAQPLRRRLRSDDVALMVEREYPQLEGGLVSSVQLAREMERDDLYTSRALIQATIDRTAERAGELDFGRVVRTGPLVPLWLMIGGFVLMGGLLLSNPTVAEYAGVFFQRVAYGAQADYPKLVHLRVGLPEVIQVAKGDDLLVQAFVDKGGYPDLRLTVTTEFEGSSERERREMIHVRGARASGDGEGGPGQDAYEKTYQNVTEPFTFYVEAPAEGVYSRRHRVEVVTRPRVEDYQFALDYPDYIGKPTEVVRQPDLQVPAGTTISYAVLSNKPLAEARLQLLEEPQAARRRGEQPQLKEGARPALLGEVEAPPERLQPALEALQTDATAKEGAAGDAFEARVVLGELTVKDDTSFQFAFRSEEGLSSGERPVRFSVRVVEDRPPVVRIPVPGRRKQVTPQARVPLEIVARDDYGLADLLLRVAAQKEGAEEPSPSDYTRTQLPIEADAKEARPSYTLDVADARLQPGDRLYYEAVAFDRNVDESRRSKASRRFELTVVRPEDLERILQDRLSALKQRLEATAKDQGEARKETETFVSALAPKDVLTEEDRRALQRLAQDQRRVTSRLEEAREELAQMTAEREYNRLTEEAAMALLSELSEGVRDLQERASPLVTRELEDGRAAPALSPGIRTRLGRVPDLQHDIERSIRALATRIDKWGDFTEVLQEVRDLLSGEERIIEGTEKAAQSEHR